MSIRGYLITGAVAAVLAGGAAWTAQGWRYTAQIAEIERDQALTTSNAQASARAKEQEYAKLNARVDGQYLELAAAQLEAADLSAVVAAGNKRLSVRTVPYQAPVECPAVPAPPAWTMKRHAPTLTQEMLGILSPSLPGETRQFGN